MILNDYFESIISKQYIFNMIPRQIIETLSTQYYKGLFENNCLVMITINDYDIRILSK